eukprot:g30911.t1
MASQVDRVVKKAFSTLAFISQSIEYRSWDVLLQLYRRLVPSQQLQGSSSKVEDEGEIARPCRDSGPLKGYEDYRRAALGGREADKVDLCVHFAKGEGRVAGSSRSECPLKEAKGSPACHIDTLPSGGLRKGNGGGGGDGRGPSTAGEEDMAPSRCIYCRDVFQDNGPGSCRDAPDPAEHCVRQLSCMWLTLQLARQKRFELPCLKLEQHGVVAVWPIGVTPACRRQSPLILFPSTRTF